MADAKAGGHGHSDGIGIGGKLIAIAAGLAGIVLAVHMGLNVIRGVPPFEGIGLPQAQAGQLQGVTNNASGIRVHAPNSAPANAQRCTQVVNGVRMTGRCW